LFYRVHLTLQYRQLSGILPVALDQKKRGPNDDHTNGGCHGILGRLAVLLSRCGSGSS
jgi:hypothetical protein